MTPPREHGKPGQELAGDEGYLALAEMARLQSGGIRTVVSDPQAGRRRKEASVQDRRVLRRASRATGSASGKALLRRRGEYVERAFAPVLDRGGLRRATLKGYENLSKRYPMGAPSFNLSLPLRSLFGIGTAKPWLAAPRRAVFVRVSFFETRKAQLTIFLRCLRVELASGGREKLRPRAGSQILPARLTT